METKTITIEVETTDNPGVFKVAGKTTMGRGQLKSALVALAKDAAQQLVDELIPLKPKGTPPEPAE